MSWFPDLLRQAIASTKLMLAILVTSVASVLAPYHSKIFIIPVQWQWVPFVTGIFSFTMIVLSLVLAAWKGALRIRKIIASKKTKLAPIGLELELLKTIGKEYGEEEVDLEDLDYSNQDRLEILSARDSLAEKDFISIDDEVRTLVKMTKSGRDFLQKLKK